MIILILVSLLIPQTTKNVAYQQPAQTQINHENLKQQAQELSDAVVKGDFARAADLTYPKLVRLMGGRTQFIAAFKKSMAEIPSDQFRLSKVTVADSRDIQKINREHYAIVPTKMEMKVREGTLVGEAYMIGISTDGGQNWTFVDGGNNAMDKTKVAALFGPEVAEKLRIPEQKRPVLHRTP